MTKPFTVVCIAIAVSKVSLIFSAPIAVKMFLAYKNIYMQMIMLTVLIQEHREY